MVIRVEDRAAILALARGVSEGDDGDGDVRIWKVRGYGGDGGGGRYC